MPSRVTIPIVGQKTVYDVDSVAKVMAQLEPQENPPLKRLYQHMIDQSGERWLIKPSNATSLDWVKEECPNFAAVVDDLVKSLHLALFGNGRMQFTPILLVSAPGVGKTHFCKVLARAMATDFEKVNMATASCSWILAGAGSGWKGAKVGRVANSLVRGSVANPLFLLDELDKVGASSQAAPDSALHDLLEPETSDAFRDEFLDIEIDTSAFSWIATANYPERIEEPIRKRMNIYEIKPITREQGRTIGRSIYAHLLATNNWAFTEALSDDALDVLEGIEPREMNQRFLDALGSARVARRDYLRPEDFKTTGAKEEKRAIGF